MYYTVLDCIGLKLSAHRLTVDGLQVRCTVGSAYNLKSEVQEHTSRRSPRYGERENGIEGLTQEVACMIAQ